MLVEEGETNSTDQDRDGLCSTADQIAHKCQGVGYEEHVSSPEDVGETSTQSECDGLSKNKDKNHPSN